MSDCLRVVVAEDEPDLRLLLRLQLEAAGFAVVGEAADGAEALALCAAERPDAIVMDLLMPGTSGIEAIERLRHDGCAVGIVAYTAVAGEMVRDMMRRLGVPLLLKTGRSEPLVDAVRSVAGPRG